MDNIEIGAKNSAEAASNADRAATAFSTELQSLGKLELSSAQSFPKTKENDENTFTLAAHKNIQDRPPRIEPIPPWKPDPWCRPPFDPWCKPEDPPMPWDPKPKPKEPPQRRPRK